MYGTMVICGAGMHSNGTEFLGQWHLALQVHSIQHIVSASKEKSTTPSKPICLHTMQNMLTPSLCFLYQYYVDILHPSAIRVVSKSWYFLTQLSNNLILCDRKQYSYAAVPSSQQSCQWSASLNTEQHVVKLRFLSKPQWFTRSKDRPPVCMKHWFWSRRRIREDLKPRRAEFEFSTICVMRKWHKS